MTEPAATHPRRADPDCSFIAVGDKDWKAYQRQLWDQGWYPLKKKKGILWLAPNGGQLLIHGTPGDGRALRNNRAEARRLGADV